MSTATIPAARARSAPFRVVPDRTASDRTASDRTVSRSLLVTAVLGGGFVGLGVLLVPQTVPIAGTLATFAAVAAYALTVARNGPSSDDGAPSTAPPGEPGAGERPRREARVPLARGRLGIRVGVEVGTAVAVVILVLGGMVTGLGEATGPLLLLAAFGGMGWGWSRLQPTLQSVWVGRVGIGADCPAEPSLDIGPRPLVAALDSLSTPALCAQWQRSYRALHDSAGPAARRDVVELGRRYLHELIRRDPAAVTRWLATESRPAATNPGPYLSASPAPQRPSLRSPGAGGGSSPQP